MLIVESQPTSAQGDAMLFNEVHHEYSETGGLPGNFWTLKQKRSLELKLHIGFRELEF
jgi:hypothetical protein